MKNSQYDGPESIPIQLGTAAETLSVSWNEPIHAAGLF